MRFRRTANQTPQSDLVYIRDGAKALAVEAVAARARTTELKNFMLSIVFKRFEKIVTIGGTAARGNVRNKRKWKANLFHSSVMPCAGVT
jgi:hypothetical protein